MTPLQILTAILVTAIYAALAVGSIPRLHMNRATIALVGAALLVLVGLISEDQAIHAIDVGTILLLAAMMVINVNLRMAGFFRFVASHTLRIARSPRMLLALLIGASGILSAFFLNDTICLMLTPLIVDLMLRLRRDPLPYLIGLGVSANIGSVATITGNPQNLIIGQASHIPYMTFMAYLAPVAVVGLITAWGVLVIVYREEFRTPLDTVTLPPPRPYTPLLQRAAPVIALLLIAFVIGAPIVTAACVAAGALLISRLRPSKLLHIDWELLALFAGLFVVTGALEVTGLSGVLFEATQPLLQSGLLAFSVLVGVLSNLVSNVPAVLLLRSHIAAFPHPQQAWLALAMASTLAGNFTLLGSAATLIVAELAALRGVKVGFVAFLKAGVPITLLTMLFGIVWLSVVAR